MQRSAHLLLLSLVLTHAPTIGAEPRVSGLLDLGVVSRGDGPSSRTRWGDERRRGVDLVRSALALTDRIDGNTRFHLHFEHASTVNTPRATSALSEFWIHMLRVRGKVGARIGVFALPMSLEHLGPLRTLPWTVTPSALSGFLETARIRGVEFRKHPVPPGHHFDYRFGAGKGAQGVSVIGRPFSFTDQPVTIATGDAEGGIAYYGLMGKRHSNSCDSGRLAWHVAYFHNGGDGVPTVDGALSDETRLRTFDAQFWRGDVGIVTQGMIGRSRRNAAYTEDFEAIFALANVRLDRRASLSLRYDDWDRTGPAGLPLDAGHAWTLAWNRNLGEKSAVQVEFLRPRPAGVDAPRDHDQFQIRYRLRF